MKILLLITDLEIGGTPTVVRELAIRLPADVVSLAPDGPVSHQIRAAGRSVVSLNARSPADLPLAVSRLVRLIRREGFDTLFSFLVHANAVATLASLFCPEIRLIQSIQTTQRTPRWHWVLQSLIHRAADTIVVPSPSAATAAMEWSDIPANKIAIIPNAIDITEISPRRGGRTIGFIGRLDPIKRVRDLLEAMTYLDPTYRLDIFGEGADRANIEQSIARLNLASRVRLHGAIEPQQALEKIDLLVLPSEAEGFGLVLIEAMAAGVPVVATDVSGIRDVVSHGRTGLLVPARDSKALAAAILRISTDPLLQERLIHNGRREVEARFTWDRILPLYQARLASPSA